jgi:hypothetical protein
MPYCEFCGDEIGNLPFKCKYCGGTYCSMHRLPENHKCSFDLKHQLKISKPVKTTRQLYEGGNYQQSEKFTFRTLDKRIKPKFSKGTLTVYSVILTFSILSYFYPIYFQYSPFSVLITGDFYFWTLFTTIFIFNLSNPFEIAILIILFIVSYQFIRDIEYRYGMLFLFKLYIIFVYFAVIIIWVFFVLFYQTPTFFFPMLAFVLSLPSSGLLGLILFSIVDNLTQRWRLFQHSLHRAHVLGFLILFILIMKIFIGEYFALYWILFDVCGLIAAFIYHEKIFNRSKH